MFERTITPKIADRLFTGKTIILMGARQVGKTTLVKKLFKSHEGETLSVTGDEPDIGALFSEITSTRLNALIGDKKIVFIDEAQLLLANSTATRN